MGIWFHCQRGISPAGPYKKTTAREPGYRYLGTVLSTLGVPRLRPRDELISQVDSTRRSLFLDPARPALGEYLWRWQAPIGPNLAVGTVGSEPTVSTFDCTKQPFYGPSGYCPTRLNGARRRKRESLCPCIARKLFAKDSLCLLVSYSIRLGSTISNLPNTNCTTLETV